ncbi:hypothetical protein ScPMuIL_006295 [Solemya velum]
MGNILELLAECEALDVLPNSLEKYSTITDVVMHMTVNNLSNQMEEEVIQTGLSLANISLKENPDEECQNSEVPDAKDDMNKENEKSHLYEPNKDDQMTFNKLVMEGKRLIGEGKISQALVINKKALSICHSDKLSRKVAKMEAYLREHGDNSSSEEDEEDGMVMIGKGFYLYKELHSKLYAHQKQGVLWFWELYKKRKGGILGDDMGLGKTIQVIAFLSGMFDMNKIKSVLIAMPVSVICNWEKEFHKWSPGINVHSFHGTSKRERERALMRVQRRGGVCLTSYGMVVTSWEQLSQQEGREFVWDYMILDEGHKIKNPTKTTKGVHAISARNRVILTGTPIQNNLKELWSLFDFVHQGTLLGTARTFKMEYENPITRARERDATPGEKRLGMEMADSLKAIIAPYFLRRTKAEVSASQKNNQESEDKEGTLTKMPSFSRKNDLIVWLFLTSPQIKIYQDFLSLDTVKELLMTKKSPLVALTVLKKICDHPRLLSTRACTQLGLDGEERLDDSILDTPEAHEAAANKVHNIADEILMNESGKVLFLIRLLDNLKKEGHRCLIFSQSRKMLDVIQKIINNRGHKVMRLDGTVRLMCERDQRIKKFQTDNSYNVFLLTTQVGGVGLTLTAADRVVIFDPSWNPATDAQAVDRVFRIGQNKNVVIYRLITCGTVEEKIYRRQVFKDSITRQTTGNTKNPYRYFTKQELRELFSLDNPHSSKTQQQLEEMHSDNRRSDTQLDEHIAFLHSLDIFGLSDHDLMFSEENDPAEEHMEGEEAESQFGGTDYIQHRVQKAQELLKMESNLSSSVREQMNKYPRSIDVDRERNQNTAALQPYGEPKTNTIKFPKREPFAESIDLTSESPPKERPNFIKNEADQSDPVRIKKEEGSSNSSLYDAIPDSGDDDKTAIEKVIKKEGSPSEYKHMKIKTEEFPSDCEVIHDSGSDDNETYESAKERTSESDNHMEESRTDDNIAKSDDKEIVCKSPERLKRFDEEMVMSPAIARTPVKKMIILEEEMIISPDASRRLVDVQPKLPHQRHASHSSSSSSDSPVSRFNITLMSAISDSPAVNEASPNPQSFKQNRTNFTVVEDSPEISCIRNGRDSVVVSESPETKSWKSDRIKNICVADSVENSPAIAMNTNVSQVKDSVENTPEINHENYSGDDSKVPSEEYKDCLSDSDKENSVVRDDEEIMRVDSPKKIPSERLSLKCDKDKSVLGEDLDMSYNDSPIRTVPQKNRQRVIIESSDEDMAVDPNKDKSYTKLDSSDDNSSSESEAVESDGMAGSIDGDSSDGGMYSDTNMEPKRRAVASDSGDQSDDDLSGFIVDSAEESEGEESSEEYSDEEEDISEEEEEMPKLPNDLKVMFESLVKKGRSLYKQNQFEEALANILQALEISPDPALQTLALKLHQKIKPIK